MWEVAAWNATLVRARSLNPQLNITMSREYFLSPHSAAEESTSKSNTRSVNILLKQKKFWSEDICEDLFVYLERIFVFRANLRY